MKLKQGFVARQVADKHILLSTDGTFHGFVRSNPTAAFIVDCLAEETTRSEIVAKLMAKYDAPEAVIAEDVGRVLDTLERIGALDG